MKPPLPLSVTLPLAVVDTVGVIAATNPWLPRRPSPIFLVVAVGNGLLIGLLLSIQIKLLVWLKKHSRAKRAEAESWGSPFPSDGREPGR